MKLAVFDLDGTLALTNSVDGRCYLAAFREALDLDGFDGDWSIFPDRTDSGIGRELYRRCLGRLPEMAELDRARDRFVALLEEALAQDPGEFRPVPGAPALLDALPGYGWAVVLATGGWRASAELKLRAAGLDAAVREAAPLVTADDGVSRREIVEGAIRAAGERHLAGRSGAFERVVCLGDGTWDLAVAAELGLPFVGVTAEGDARSLRDGGASHLLSDYTDRATALEALELAAIPRKTQPGGPRDRGVSPSAIWTLSASTR
ncbi:MAG TPA: HAD family hydrolase [Thermoanaerobaculia bacterium]|nr:HAD family hydrolase [Thermoanaerobaculia bacterium]